MAKYRRTEAAHEDLENIYRFGIMKFGERQADRYYFGLVKCMENIVKNPLQFLSYSWLHQKRLSQMELYLRTNILPY